MIIFLSDMAKFYLKNIYYLCEYSVYGFQALCLGHTALGETTVGQVINLISNDANRFDTTLPGIQYLVIGPVQTVMITYLVWREIGISSLIGVSTLLIFIPIQG